MQNNNTVHSEVRVLISGQTDGTLFAVFQQVLDAHRRRVARHTVGPSEEALSEHRSSVLSQALVDKPSKSKIQMRRNSVISNSSECNETSGEDRPIKKIRKPRREHQLRFYAGKLKTVMILAKDLFRTYMLAVNAYPSDKQTIIATKECFEEACKKLYGNKYRRKSFSQVLCNYSSLFADALSEYNDNIRTVVSQPSRSLSCVSLNNRLFRLKMKVGYYVVR